MHGVERGAIDPARWEMERRRRTGMGWKAACPLLGAEL